MLRSSLIRLALLMVWSLAIVAAIGALGSRDVDPSAYPLSHERAPR